jgi:hypothetical protein
MTLGPRDTLLGPFNQARPQSLRIGIEHDIGAAIQHLPEAVAGFVFQLTGSPAAVSQVNPEIRWIGPLRQSFLK